VRAAGTWLERLQTTFVEGMDRVAYRLRTAAQILSYLRHPPAAGAGQQNLCATEDECLRRAQGLLQSLTLAIRQLTDEDRLLHALSVP
jgi:hypothetical protein